MIKTFIVITLILLQSCNNKRNEIENLFYDKGGNKNNGVNLNININYNEYLIEAKISIVNNNDWDIFIPNNNWLIETQPDTNDRIYCKFMSDNVFNSLFFYPDIKFSKILLENVNQNNLLDFIAFGSFYKIPKRESRVLNLKISNRYIRMGFLGQRLKKDYNYLCDIAMVIFSSDEIEQLLAITENYEAIKILKLKNDNIFPIGSDGYSTHIMRESNYENFVGYPSNLKKTLSKKFEQNKLKYTLENIKYDSSITKDMDMNNRLIW